MSGPNERDEIAAVLGEHILREVDPACSCGWDWDYREVILPSEVDFDSSRYRLPATVRPEQHRRHLADLLAERDRRTAAKTLREAADLGPINFAMTHEAPHWRGYNHLVTTQWLRERADRIERGE